MYRAQGSAERMGGKVWACCTAAMLILALAPKQSLVWGSTSDGPLCRPQKQLKLSKPYQAPAVPLVRLPFCEAYDGCSCCNASHAIAIRRSLGGALDDEAISPACRRWTAVFACRVCDPHVGTGAKPSVCLETCDSWHTACQNDFFEFVDGGMLPCSASTQRSLVCSQLKELATDGDALCKAAGLHVAGPGGGRCFDGSVPDPLPSCVAARATGGRVRRQSKRGPTALGRVWAALTAWRVSREHVVWAGAAAVAVVAARRLWAASVARRRRLRSGGRFPGQPRFLN